MVTIKEVLTKKEQKLFCDFPNQMYKDVPQFVPSLLGDDINDWNPKKNTAFEYCEAKCFLAYKDDKLVGRIGAILSRRANEKWNTKRMRFTQVDFIDDNEVVDALFATVEKWAKEKGCNEVHGPLGFCDLDKEGMLVEGYDRRSLFYTYYNYPYYNTQLQRVGYGKDVDWIEDLIEVPYDTKEAAMLDKLAKYVEKQQNLHYAVLKSRSDFKPYVKKVFELVNIAYSHLYGVVELTGKQIDKYSQKFIPLINPDFACFILNEKEELVGFSVASPSIDAASQKCHGRLFPTGWFHILRSLHKSDQMDMLLVAVRPDYQSTGTNAMLLNHVLKGCQKMGVRYAETGPQLELNDRVQAQWSRFNPVQHKRRRCYIKKLEN